MIVLLLDYYYKYVFLKTSARESTKPEATANTILKAWLAEFRHSQARVLDLPGTDATMVHEGMTTDIFIDRQNLFDSACDELVALNDDTDFDPRLPLVVHYHQEGMLDQIAATTWFLQNYIDCNKIRYFVMKLECL